MLNRQEIIGNLGKDPAYRVTANNRGVCDFSVASSEKWTGDDGQKHEETEWFNVVVWGKLAEVARDYLHKGSKVYLAGKTKTRKWQDKDGHDRYTPEVIVDKLVMLDGPPAGGRSNFDAGDRLSSFDCDPL